jgi:hypothetical protein
LWKYNLHEERPVFHAPVDAWYSMNWPLICYSGLLAERPLAKHENYCPLKLEIRLFMEIGKGSEIISLRLSRT